LRILPLLLLLGSTSFNVSAENIAIGDAAGWTGIGRANFERCEFKAAATAFTKALHYQPEDAGLHHWLGKSYARMAEVASPLHASRDARRARLSLERAVELSPNNQEYLRELFDLYLDSPEWFSGGLEKAANLVERIEPNDPGAQALLRTLLSGARSEYSGTYWRLRQATLLPSAQIGRVVP
jgi:tetratricopeptide (TPR) repeat protein